MKNQRFALRSGLGWGAASAMIGTEMTKKIGWVEEAGVMSTDPTIVGGFSEILKYWQPENDQGDLDLKNDMAFNYYLPKDCNVCMGDETPFDEDDEKCTKIDIEDKRCMCNAADDPQHLCPHYRELGDDPLDVYVTLVKIKRDPNIEGSGMFYYNENCNKTYHSSLCPKDLVPKPLLEYGYFPVPIPRFKISSSAIFYCPWPLWISDLLPVGAKLDDKVKLAKEGFGDDEVITTTEDVVESVEREL